jgi:2-polyprenyl-3-methyl-5-hydroxy-6-metoxy-1,4-benzoquinol methylase
MVNKNCPICNNTLVSKYRPWHWLCKRCKYEKANFESTINTTASHHIINEISRESGLRTLRISNFKKLLSKIRSCKPLGGKLLDVGCAHGWFLDLAKPDFEVLGIEPDQQVFNKTIERHLPVRMGYFPDVLTDNEKFDVIIFNDVIEHIPDINNVLSQCRERLNTKGLLVLNLPSSDGFFYRISKFLFLIGIKSFFDRMWQKDFPSPHLHYLNKNNLTTLLKNYGFSIQNEGCLDTLHFSGLYEKISFTNNSNKLSQLILYLLVASFLPILKIMPSDIIYIMATDTD